jgi:hypothetical protein
MSIVLGSRTDFIDNTSFPLYIDVAGIDQNHFVNAYRRGSQGFLICGSVSGLVPTLDSEGSVFAPGGTTGQMGVTRLDDDNGVVMYKQRGDYACGCKCFSRSGVILSVGSHSDSTVLGNYADICSMDDSTVVVVGSARVGNKLVYVVAATVNKATQAFTWGSVVNKTGLRSKTLARVENFDDTYGIIALQSETNGYEQLLLFSLSGTTVTLGSFIDFSTSNAEWSSDVCCLSSTKCLVAYLRYDSGDNNWDLRVKLMTRSGLTLSEDDDVVIFEGLNFATRATNISISIENDSRAVIFFYDRDGKKFYAEQLLISGGSIEKVLNNFEIDNYPTYAGTGIPYPRIDYFPGATTPSAVFAYDYLETNYKGVVKIGNPTWGAFIPRIMVI